MYNTLKGLIDQYIIENTSGEITGEILNNVLNQMVSVLGSGSKFKGSIQPDSEAPSGTEGENDYFYIATSVGTYTNFGDITVSAGELAFVKKEDSSWVKYSWDISSLLSGKQDTISDLATIRSGASAGATAYQKPQNGIPKTDLASDVQTSLGKADTAIQEHQDISGKANKDELVIVTGEGGVLDGKAIINLKAGTQVTVLTKHQDITGKADKSDTYTKSEVDAKVTSVMRYKGSVNNYAALEAIQNPSVGDVYNVLDTGHNYAYDGTSWDVLSDIVSVDGKADKVSNATNGNFAGLDANGNLIDSGSKASDFATASQGAKADTAYQKPQTGIPETDLSSDVQQALQKHFKGWWPDLATLKAAHTAVEGDSAYVKDASPATTWSIYMYDSTASSDNYWADSGTDADTSSVQTFASGEEVNDVHIVNDLTTGGVDDVLSAEQGKVLGDRLNAIEPVLEVDDYKTTNYFPLLINVSAGTELTPSDTYTSSNISSSTGLVINGTGCVKKFSLGENQKHLLVSGRSPGVSNFTMMSAFDSSDNLIGIYFYFLNQNITDGEVILPSKTSYIYIFASSDSNIKAKLAVSSAIMKPEDYVDNTELANEFQDFANENLRVENTVSLSLSDVPSYTGLVVSTQTVGSAININTTFGTTYAIFNIPANSQVSATFLSGGSYGFVITDTDDKVLEYTNNSVGSKVFNRYTQATKFYVTIPKFGTASVSTLSILNDTVQELNDAVIEIQEELENVGNTNQWMGKTLWWCGTSIPAGSDATLGMDETVAGNYPTQVGNMLNCTVINKAVGGSMCRTNVRTGDYVNGSFSNFTSRLSMTNEEAEYFITNYDTIKTVLIGNPPSTLTDAQKSRLRNAGFENRLLPFLTGTSSTINPTGVIPDLFVLDHGHNDFKTNYSMPNPSGTGTIPDIELLPTVENIQNGLLAEDTYMTANNNAKLEYYFGSLANIPTAKKAEFIASVNRNCYIGAMNFIITLILRYNPHARIVFISNYEYENGTLPHYAPIILAQEELSKEWALPLCEVYKYLGYSNKIIPSSMSWFNTNYPSQTAVTTDITVFKAYCPDGVHPASDISGDANLRYALILSNWIRNL